jgi:glycosyltransferase involved in cell wall biosynthesis
MENTGKIQDLEYSVLMAVHNNEDPQLFDQAMESIVAQSSRPADVVLVKDGPLTVELDSIVFKYSQRLPINVISLNMNRGLGIALKEGLVHCKYALVGRADSDDINLPHRFKTQVNFLNERLDVDVLGSNLVELDGKIRRIKKVPLSVTVGFKTFFRNPLNHQTVMFRKQAVMAVGGYEDCPSFEDYTLWCKLLKNGTKIVNLDEPLVEANIDDLIGKRSGHQYAKKEKAFYQKLYYLFPMYKLIILLAASSRISLRYIPSALVTKIYYSLRITDR